MIRHKRSDHDSNAVLRRTAQPSIVSSRLIALMPKVPKILPAYMTEYRLVRPAPITRQRHEIIMPSVSFLFDMKMNLLISSRIGPSTDIGQRACAIAAVQRRETHADDTLGKER